MNNINKKNLAIMPLGYVKRLPVEFAPVFYNHVVDQLVDVDNPMLNNLVLAFRNETNSLNQLLMDEVIYKDSSVLDMFHQAEKVWQGVRYAIQSFCHCGEESVEQMAVRALEINGNHRVERLRRLDAAEQLNAFVAEIEDCFTPEELAESFLAYWINRLKTVSSEYTNLFQQRLERNAQRVYFTHQREVVHDKFNLLYLSIYVMVKESGDETLASLLANLNELIGIYTTIAKARKTRIYNQNHPIDDNENLVEEASDNQAKSDDEVASAPNGSPLDDKEQEPALWGSLLSDQENVLPPNNAAVCAIAST